MSEATGMQGLVGDVTYLEKNVDIGARRTVYYDFPMIA